MKLDLLIWLFCSLAYIGGDTGDADAYFCTDGDNIGDGDVEGRFHQ